MSYYMFINKVHFPVTPGRITTKVNGNNKTVTLINEGEVNVIKKPGLTDIIIDELLLPAFTKYPFANYAYLTKKDEIAVYKKGKKKGREKEKFHKAKYYLDKLEKWKKECSPVKWKMIRISPDGKKLLWDSSMYVTIEDYEIIEDAEEYGFDVAIKLEMKQYRFYGAKKLVKKKNNKHKVKKKRPFTARSGGYYKVRKGDTLRSIARMMLGDEREWKYIYKLNKKTIEEKAKKKGRKSSSNGHYIYPGTELLLPSVPGTGPAGVSAGIGYD